MNLTSGVIAIEQAGFPWAWLAIGAAWLLVAAFACCVFWALLGGVRVGGEDGR